MLKHKAIRYSDTSDTFIYVKNIYRTMELLAMSILFRIQVEIANTN